MIYIKWYHGLCFNRIIRCVFAEKIYIFPSRTALHCKSLYFGQRGLSCSGSPWTWSTQFINWKSCRLPWIHRLGAWRYGIPDKIAVLCLVLFKWILSEYMSCFYPYASGLLRWHWGNRMIALVPVKQPWRIWVKLIAIDSCNDACCLVVRSHYMNRCWLLIS